MQGLFIFVILLACLFYADTIDAQSPQPETIITISVEKGFDKNFLFPVIPKARLVMNGEMHYVSSNPFIKFQLVKILHEKNSVRYLIMECGPAMAYLLNEYLKTGNDTLIRWNRYLNFEISFWKQLKAFNDGLLPAEKLEVLAFDYDQPDAHWRMARLVLPASLEDTSANDLLQHLKKICAPTMKVSDIPTANKLLTSLLGQHFMEDPEKEFVLEMIAQNKVPMISQTKRDNFTYENFKKYVPVFTRGNFFAEYGVAHVDKNLHHLSYKLDSEEDSPLKGNVFTIVPHLFNSVSGGKLYADFGTPGSDKLPPEIVTSALSDISILSVDKTNMSRKKIAEAPDLILILKNQRVIKAWE